jgi:uncharacterized tellurite resistance protein B-like protein
MAMLQARGKEFPFSVTPIIRSTVVISTDERLPSGERPQFTVDVSAAGAAYARQGVPSNAGELASALHDAATYRSAVPAATAAVAIAAVVAVAISGWLAAAVLIAGIALLMRQRIRDARRRYVAILYRVDDTAARKLEALRNGVGWLQSCRAVWRMTSESTRVSATVADRAVPQVATNVAVPSITAGDVSLFFFPHVLMIRNGVGDYAHVAYPSIVAQFETMHFSEAGFVPDDSETVGSTWLYANKNGTPDRRRANNRQIPLLAYGRVTLTLGRSNNLVLLVSHPGAARHFVNALTPLPEVPVILEQRREPGPQNDLERALQASIDLRRKQEELQRQAAAAAAAKRSETPLLPGEWLAQGGSANVHGFATGDFVYVGNELVPLGGRSNSEPSLINPALPIDREYANSAGSGMTYWPSYNTISASSRRAYLEWLAGGRRDPHAYIGYVFLFFYGLERRVYEFMQGRGSSGDEVLAIAREVARLIELYGGRSASFHSYATSMLDLIAFVEPRAAAVQKPSLRHVLGELAIAGKPIPAALALQWVRSSWSLNTPATRCPAEFELLFHIRYAKAFGDGLIVRAAQQTVRINYHPASAALDDVAMKQRTLPDVTQLTAPLRQLIQIAQECTGALDPFSRFLGKNENGRESLAAFALLPEDLVEATPSADAFALASLVRSRLDANGRAHLAAGELLQFARVANPDKVTKNESMLLAQALEKLGYGIEPDVRLGGPSYDTDGRVVVFRRLPDCPSAASDEFAAAMLLVRLGAMVSTADNAVSDHERALLERHIEDRLQLTAGERQRLAAHLAWLLESDLGMTGLKRRLEVLDDQARHTIGRLLVDVAAIDGHIDPREMKMLEKLYALLGLASGDLYRDVHAAQAHDDEPVAIAAQTAQPKGFAIPPPATPKPGIDMDRVRRKMDETRQVSSLLASIFVDEAGGSSVPPPAAAAAASANTIGPLDAAQSELLRRLTSRESWPRDEVERIAAELSLLTDGALEAINDYAYATADEPLWEDDDPLTINSRVAMELIA